MKGRIHKLKRDHIKEVNKLLDENFTKEPKKEEEVKLNPSDNVQNSNDKFVEKMNRLL
jgi:hypothetical protein